LSGCHDQGPYQGGILEPHPRLHAALESLPEDADLTALEERIEPIISRADGVQRIEGQRRD